MEPFPVENQPFRPRFGFEGNTLVVGLRESESELDGDTADTLVNSERLE